MPIIESCLSVLSATSSVTGIHSWFTGLKTGSEIKTILQDQKIIRSQIERLSDNILYLPSIKQVDTINETSTRVQNLRDLRQLLDPVQRHLNEDILSTAILSTPSKLKEAFNKDPWKILFDIRPAEYAHKSTNPDHVPILFNDNGILYIGWQTSGALPILFDCRYDQKIQESEKNENNNQVIRKTESIKKVSTHLHKTKRANEESQKEGIKIKNLLLKNINNILIKLLGYFFLAASFIISSYVLICITLFVIIIILAVIGSALQSIYK